MIDRDILAIMIDDGLMSFGSKQFVASLEIVDFLLDLRLYVFNEESSEEVQLEESTVGATA